jgi:hypothetical protein
MVATRESLRVSVRRRLGYGADHKGRLEKGKRHTPMALGKSKSKSKTEHTPDTYRALVRTVARQWRDSVDRTWLNRVLTSVGVAPFESREAARRQYVFRSTVTIPDVTVRINADTIEAAKAGLEDKAHAMGGYDLRYGFDYVHGNGRPVFDTGQATVRLSGQDENTRVPAAEFADEAPPEAPAVPEMTVDEIKTAVRDALIAQRDVTGWCGSYRNAVEALELEPLPERKAYIFTGESTRTRRFEEVFHGYSEEEAKALFDQEMASRGHTINGDVTAREYR